MTAPLFAQLPEPPYYSVIFSSQRTAHDEGYNETADRMLALAASQPGYLGVESVRDADGFGITVSYWADLASIANWKAQVEHTQAQDNGKRLWYQHYELRIARVERAYAKVT